MSEIIECRRENIEEIASRFLRGEVGIIPGDTIYGISSAVSEEGRMRIYEIKERPKSKSFIVLMTKKQLEESSLTVPSSLLALWPAPLTCILGSSDGSTLAVRVPDDEFLQALLPLSGPLYSTSVNISGSDSLLSFDSILPVFGDKVDFIVRRDGKGESMSSTLVDCTEKPYRVIRQGSYIFTL